MEDIILTELKGVSADFNERLKILQANPDPLSYRTLGARIYQTILEYCSSSSPFVLEANAVISRNLSEVDETTALLGVLNAVVESAEQYGYCTPTDENEAYKAYNRHAVSIRNWFIAYGVGGPVLLATHESLMKQISEAGNGTMIAALFLAGVGLQVLSTIIYKAAAWSTMDYATTPASIIGWWPKLASKITNSVLLEMITDFGTVGLFALATIIVFKTIG